MIRSKSFSLILFGILSIFTMIGCGGNVATPQSKTTTPPTPAAAVVFQGTFNLTFNDNLPDAMDVQIAFNQADTNITGHGIASTATYHRNQLDASCIDLAGATVTQGTIQGSSFALILTDPSRQTFTISGTISPLQGNYGVAKFISPCGYGSNMTGTVSFQKVGA